MEEDPAGDRPLAEEQVRSGGKQSSGKPLEHDLGPDSLHPCLLLYPRLPSLFTVAYHLTNLGQLMWRLLSVGTESEKLLTQLLTTGMHQ